MAANKGTIHVTESMIEKAKKLEEEADKRSELPHIESYDIKETVKSMALDVISMGRKKKIAKLTKKYNDLAMKYPTLFNMVVNNPQEFLADGKSKVMLDMLLEKRQLMESANHNKQEVESQVSSALLDSFGGDQLRNLMNH
jgi:hypothetical protein